MRGLFASVSGDCKGLSALGRRLRGQLRTWPAGAPGSRVRGGTAVPMPFAAIGARLSEQ